jgi:hypothetical protein
VKQRHLHVFPDANKKKHDSRLPRFQLCYSKTSSLRNQTG